MDQPKTRLHFVDTIQPGNIVAFNTDTCMASGKVLQVQPTQLVIRTLNGSIFYQPKDTIVWVKQGTRWPLGIYNALRYPKAPTQPNYPTHTPKDHLPPKE